MPRSRPALALAAFLTSTGVAHFAVPRFYDHLIPEALGSPRGWVYGSGVAELACGALLYSARTRRLGGLAAAALFVAVFPGNVKMALDGGIPDTSGPLGSPALAWARLPLQIPLVWWALRVARRPSEAAEPAEAPKAAR